MERKLELKTVDTLDLDEIKSTIEEGKELTEAKVEKTLDYSNLKSHYSIWCTRRELNS